MNTSRFDIRTTSRNCSVNITPSVVSAVENSGLLDGVAVVYIPHTTAGVSINEGADPDVMRDIMGFLEQRIPDSSAFRHSEGNSDAHIKASIVGSSATVPFSQGKLLLGTWQKIFFMEFDGPRDRHYFVKTIKA